MNWISVEDKLPPLLQKVLFCWICPGTNRNISMGYLCDQGWDIYIPYNSFKMSNEYFTVTHWMELPDYPQIDREKLELDQKTKEFARRFIDENIDLLNRLANK